MKNPIILEVPSTATDEELHQMALLIVANINRQRDETLAASAADPLHRGYESYFW